MKMETLNKYKWQNKWPGLDAKNFVDKNQERFCPFNFAISLAFWIKTLER
jgi:hypothetical protein